MKQEINIQKLRDFLDKKFDETQKIENKFIREVALNLLTETYTFINHSLDEE